MQIINMWSGEVVFEEERPLPNEEDLIRYIKELEQKAEAGENLKCCGNCSHTNDDFECNFELPMTRWSNCCPKWQTDQMTRDQRMKK